MTSMAFVCMSIVFDLIVCNCLCFVWRVSFCSQLHWEQKDTIRHQAQSVTHDDFENTFTEKHFHKPKAGTVNHRKRYFRDIAIIPLEQNIDPVLRNLRVKTEGELLDEAAFTEDNQYQHLQNIPNLEIRQDILARKYYNDIGQLSHCQFLLPKQLLDEFLHALNGQNANLPGITKMIHEARQKH